MPVIANQAVQDLFKEHFGFRPAHITRAPAALELLGSFAPSNDGLLLSAAVDRYSYVAASPRTDGKIELIDADRAPEVFWITELKAHPASPWANLFKAVLRALRLRKVHFSGFNAAIHSDVPKAIGLGDEAASAIAAALAVRALFPFGLGESGSTLPPRRDARGHLPPLLPAERKHLALACATAMGGSSQGNAGYVQALTSLNGKQWHLLSHDCRFGSLDHHPFLGTALIVCDTGVRAPDAAEAEAEIKDACLSAARKLRAKSLRSLEPKSLRAARPQLEEREYACASHVVGEIQRVAAAERALSEEDHRQVGQYLTLSHESLRDLVAARGTGPDLLVQLARAHEGCLGARAIGVGLGAATINLVPYHSAEPFMSHMTKSFEGGTHGKLRPFVCQIVDGAG